MDGVVLERVTALAFNSRILQSQHPRVGLIAEFCSYFAEKRFTDPALNLPIRIIEHN